MAGVPRYRAYAGPAVLSAGFRPFFLLAALWSSLAVPIWIASFTARGQMLTALSPVAWHVHEMTFGFGAAAVAGFLLTAIPNWTGRMPLQGGPLSALVLLWAVGRIAVLFSAEIGAGAAAVLDLSFPLVFLLVIAREISRGRNWRNLPVVGALVLFLAGNALVHCEPLGIAETAGLGNRIGVAMLVMLISLIGGRIVPSFTRNWIAKNQPGALAPAPFDLVDRVALAATASALAMWSIAPSAGFAPWLELGAAMMLGMRLSRWRGDLTLREPLLWVLHLGYAWLPVGFLLLSLSSFTPALPQTAAVHALTAGAIGTMTLAVMTRASRGHTGRPLVASGGDTTVYALVTLAAVLRVVAPLGFGEYVSMLYLATAAWSAAFGLFVALYAQPLTSPRAA